MFVEMRYYGFNVVFDRSQVSCIFGEFKIVYVCIGICWKKGGKYLDIMLFSCIEGCIVQCKVLVFVCLCYMCFVYLDVVNGYIIFCYDGKLIFNFFCCLFGFNVYLCIDGRWSLFFKLKCLVDQVKN